jgi:hypothetical protein
MKETFSDTFFRKSKISFDTGVKKMKTFLTKGGNKMIQLKQMKKILLLAFMLSFVMANREVIK